MKIDSTPNPSPVAPTGNGATRAQSGTAQSSAQAANAGSTGGDTTVNLSGLSGQLRSVAASGNADIDTGLVQSIKDALNNGRTGSEAAYDWVTTASPKRRRFLLLS